MTGYSYSCPFSPFWGPRNDIDSANSLNTRSYCKIKSVAQVNRINTQKNLETAADMRWVVLVASTRKFLLSKHSSSVRRLILVFHKWLMGKFCRFLREKNLNSTGEAGRWLNGYSDAIAFLWPLSMGTDAAAIWKHWFYSDWKRAFWCYSQVAVSEYPEWVWGQV